MKKIVLIRSNQIQGDSRVEKYLRFFSAQSLDYEVLAWDRDDTGIDLDRVKFYRRNSGYAVGGMTAALNRLYWFLYVIRMLRQYKKQEIVIHACDVDCAYPAALYKKFFNRHAYIVFDVFDWMSDDVASKSKGMISKSIAYMESISLKYSNKLIVCEEERREQIPDYEKYDIMVLPNIPTADSMTKMIDENECKFGDDKPVFSYVGGLGYARFLDELLTLAEEGYVNLLIAGYGDKQMEDRCKKLNERDNVKYFGKVPYSIGLSIMSHSDLIYAMYCKIIRNHYYAAPNKFYEPMMLGKPLLTTKDIIIGEKVEKLGFGYTIGESYQELVDFVKSIDKVDLRRKGEVAHLLWIQKYRNYTYDFLKNQYLPLLKG